MADGTKIEWTDATWNPVTGCAVVSPGCTNCYAMKLAGTRLKHLPSRAGLTIDTRAGPVWNGTIRFNTEWLDQPMRWRRPRRIFVCAHGDLFAEGVTDAMLDQVFAVMALAPQHSFQVLTKRPERMRDYVIDLHRRCRNIGGAATDIILGHTAVISGAVKTTFPLAAGRARDTALNQLDAGLPNVWLGVSVEDQQRADQRIPILLDTPAAVRFVSAEPLLGPIDFGVAWHGEDALESECWGDCAWCEKGHPPLHNCHRGRQSEAAFMKGRSGLDWIIVGGESGHGARPMHPDWARAIRDQCADAGVPFLFKQWGEWAPVTAESDENGELDAVYPITGCSDPSVHRGEQECLFWQGDDVVRWPLIDTLPTTGVRRVGKKAAGRLLDGVTHDGFPEPRHG
ncbi:DUF5131 family protein [Aurantimonas sp. VKM B-3413]|uniref:DUF5131 family protein n=1 Tax=Aurantimonas sp. VKM B-3413 TaxID=2779401 RepID=UPI001E387326|nr:phage Gp37/Gp68 family protein [Aurantimonas sp. VKM B-3413]MCB8835975.1 phage Gp37/Gp68 family protein [Aurantimonas sp. VKM B-3413]